MLLNSKGEGTFILLGKINTAQPYLLNCQHLVIHAWLLNLLNFILNSVPEMRDHRLPLPHLYNPAGGDKRPRNCPKSNAFVFPRKKKPLRFKPGFNSLFLPV